MRIALTFLLVLSGSALMAQKKLVFQNDQLGETIEVKEGDYLKLRYKGYLDQEAEVENYVSEISDIAIHYIQPTKKEGLMDNRTIMLGDITGFRRMSKMRPFLVPLTSVGVGVGIYYTISANNSLNETEQLLYSLGASIGTSLLINRIFKTDIKLKMSDGWYIRVVLAQ
ncbi:hypothetical protein [Reichenbachiella ulvae]|uniref:Uncharacterized protein n=1 Tax=Reichenbachiella ulvae TaxID=2980104 RepID=A0ABT3CYW7_9BACT|nr:hypothetical protein [Reichenbachiella ulvae]MCV9388895.1 hypothetical protein [Reichenbachiella ulvae]